MNRITLEPGKRGGRPCIRDLRITVYDVLSMLSTNMTQQEILEDFPELEPEDIRAPSRQTVSARSIRWLCNEVVAG
jgi:uncharacterized protein (DUF433 family)